MKNLIILALLCLGLVGCGNEYHRRARGVVEIYIKDNRTCIFHVIDPKTHEYKVKTLRTFGGKVRVFADKSTIAENEITWMESFFYNRDIEIHVSSVQFIQGDLTD